MAIKILPPASPESEARGWDAAGASAAGAEAPYVDADGIERPSTPPLDATKKTPEKGPSPPSPPQPRLGGREALEAGMDTPDHRSSLRAVQLRSPGSVGGYNPPPPNTLVLYTTSLRVVRKAHHDSCLVRAQGHPELLHLRELALVLNVGTSSVVVLVSLFDAISAATAPQARGLLDTFCYVYVERDVSMSRQFQDELKVRSLRGFSQDHLPSNIPLHPAPHMPCVQSAVHARANPAAVAASASRSAASRTASARPCRACTSETSLSGTTRTSAGWRRRGTSTTRWTAWARGGGMWRRRAASGATACGSSCALRAGARTRCRGRLRRTRSSSGAPPKDSAILQPATQRFVAHEGPQNLRGLSAECGWHIVDVVLRRDNESQVLRSELPRDDRVSGLQRERDGAVRVHAREPAADHAARDGGRVADVSSSGGGLCELRKEPMEAGW